MKQNIKRQRMELLAPAGTTESLVAAIDAGADAIYLGLVEFSARMRARNFTMQTLAYAVPYAHTRNAKVYVAFNTLVKQAEIERVVHLLHQLEQIGVDGLIVQDMGVIDIARTAFPRLKLHASTQMSVHNSAGIQACGRLGMTRAVAARELTLPEITKLCASSAIEIEVFVHGALCYGISGMCLASSFFGGASGNRGRCTQVCRRSFDLRPQHDSPECEAGYFFSPNDLCGIDYLPQLVKAGVKSLKIEGRMKGPEYVRTVVSAYRMALDNPSKTATAKEMLRHDLGRRKTSLFLNGVQPAGIIDEKNPAGTGIYIGKIENTGSQSVAVMSPERVNPGDLLRIQPQSGGEGIMAGAVKCAKSDGVITIVLDKEIPCSPGDAMYCVGRETGGKKADIKLAVSPSRYEENYKGAHTLLRKYRPEGRFDKNKDRRLFVKIDKYEWLPLLAMSEIGGVICSFDYAGMQRFAADIAAREKFGRAAYIELPPFIPEQDLGQWRRLIQTLCKDGLCGLLCQNLGHIVMEEGVKRVRADYMLWCLNRAAQRSYKAMNVTHFAYSLEDDALNIRDCASQQGMAYLFGHIPLFISRIKPAIAVGSHVTDRAGRRTMICERNGLYYLVAEETVSLLHKRDKFEELGISTFVADLSFMEPSEKNLQEIVACYNGESKYPGSCLFNYKGGLK
jgi:U32 family peptidase